MSSCGETRVHGRVRTGGAALRVPGAGYCSRLRRESRHEGGDMPFEKRVSDERELPAC